MSEKNRKAYHHYLAAYNLTGPQMDPDWQADYDATLKEVELIRWMYHPSNGPFMIRSEWRCNGKQITIAEAANLEVEIHMWYEEVE
jgi:hypothetical protein